MDDVVSEGLSPHASGVDTEKLSTLFEKLDGFFRVRELDRDPSMSSFVPMVYDSIGVDWKTLFEPDFVQRFNGLMMKGADTVKTVFCSVFPTNEVLERFIDESEVGDMLFLHHPIDIECGDPRGQPGRGFLPIDAELLGRISRKKLSLYSCHAPLDAHRKIGTGVAIIEALDGKIEDNFYPYGNGFAGIIASIRQTTTERLIEALKSIFGVPYVDVAGKVRSDISRVAVVPGAGYRVTYLQECESKGVQAYLTGELFDRIEGDYGRKAFAQVESFARNTSISLIAVSHSASEYLVMKSQMVEWLEDNFSVSAKPLPLSKWWR